MKYPQAVLADVLFRHSPTLRSVLVPHFTWLTISASHARIRCDNNIKSTNAWEMSDAVRDGGQDARHREGGSMSKAMQIEATKKKRKEHAHTGFTAATMRALSARLLTFYFRAPIKAFFRPRIE